MTLILLITVFIGIFMVDYVWYTPRQRQESAPISCFLDTIQQEDIMQDIPENTDHIQASYTRVS